MLLSINTLQEIGRFAALKQKAPQFNRLTLIFARNGYGKSTICAVLRSASEGEPSYIHARRRLGAKSECHVRTNWKSAPDAVFTGGKWNTRPGNILIFDQEFVLRNLHVGDSVTRENMRSLLPVVLGKKGVELSKIIIELDREQRELDAAMKGYAAKKVGEQSETEPSFKTVLSAGDKTTLALAFFISQARSDPELSSSVVVFDDPFSSQDMHRRFETTSQIREIARNACQSIVLSHDPRFLDLIEKNAEASTTSTFQLQCADSGHGSISVSIAADELKELYIRRSEMLREYAGRGKLLKDTTDIELVQAMRPFLEDYLRARNPGRFNDMEYLFGMADAIKRAGAADPLFDSVSDLLAINEYTRPEHHGGGKTPDPDELRAHSKRIVRIIGTY